MGESITPAQLSYVEKLAEDGKHAAEVQSYLEGLDLSDVKELSKDQASRLISKLKATDTPPLSKFGEKNGEDVKALAIMSDKDEEQMIAELKGAFLEEFVYRFKVGNRDVIGLSWAGTKEIVRRQGNITAESIDVTETDKKYRVIVKAKDAMKGNSMFGAAEQSKTMKLKSGEVVQDDFALPKCVSKAQRNACRALIPEMVIKEMLKKFQEDER